MTQPDDLLERLSAIEARVERATAGEWYRVESPWLNPDCTTYVIAGNHDPHAGKPVCDFEIQADDSQLDAGEDVNDWADADFIAHARSDIPFLIEQLRLSRRRVEALEAIALRYAIADVHRAAYGGGTVHVAYRCQICKAEGTEPASIEHNLSCNLRPR